MEEESKLCPPVQEQGPEGEISDMGFFATSDIDKSELEKIMTGNRWDGVLEGKQTLVTVSLSWCKLSGLPARVTTMTRLTRLYLAYNSLTDLPEEFENLQSLQILNLAFNNFKKVPSPVCSLRKLEVLEMRGNKLTTKGLAELRKLVTLKEVYLTQNRLDSFPKEVFELKDLRLLTLCHNSIEEIPTDIGQMTKLAVLKMRSNRLGRIPDDIGTLTALELACFAQNMISQFPFDKVKHLSRLRDLCLYANRLTDKDALMDCVYQMTERGGMCRCEENRVSLPRMEGMYVCDGPFAVWKWDIVWLYDGSQKNKDWIHGVQAKLEEKHLNSTVYGPRVEQIQSAMRCCRAVCVVCTAEMARLLDEESTAQVKKSLEWYFSEVGERGLVIPVLTGKCNFVSAFLSDNRCSQSVDARHEERHEQIYKMVTERFHRLDAAPSPR